jgi:hypothetical protein
MIETETTTANILNIPVKTTVIKGGIIMSNAIISFENLLRIFPT